ncbi:MAG TPA: hypothetical protein VHA15_03095 [Burkholderiales bacterium]|nr:hypothetical protein [Burkholderiales bacterium]
MLRSNPIAFAGWALFAGALVVVFAWTHDLPRGLQTWGTELWLGFASLTGLFLWQHGMRLRTLVRAIPTSRVATAAQGYVELVGTARNARRHFPDAPEFHLWKRTQFASRSSQWRVFPFNLFYIVHSVDTTQEPFCVADDSGSALVLPAGAEVLCARREVEYDGDRKVVREHILEGDPLYVLGEFRTEREQVDVAVLTERLLNDWRMDRGQARRFDADRDGHLSGRELMAMHEAAREAAQRASADATAGEGVHMVGRGDGSRRFVISSLPPDRLAGRYHGYLAAGLALFLGSLAAAVAYYRAFLSPA